jgi:hypothetical protein
MIGQKSFEITCFPKQFSVSIMLTFGM